MQWPNVILFATSWSLSSTLYTSGVQYACTYTMAGSVGTHVVFIIMVHYHVRPWYNQGQSYSYESHAHVCVEKERDMRVSKCICAVVASGEL